MPESMSQEKRSEIMSRVRGKDTSSELAVRKELHANGFRFRLHAKHLAGKPDIVLPQYQTVVFVNGCLWHGHMCTKFRWPVANADYWRTKINKTKNRDLINISILEGSDWHVSLIWDCEINNGIASLISHLSELKRTRQTFRSVDYEI